MLTSLEICAGAGGQALGLENAGFEHLALVEIDDQACATLKSNRPNWNVLHQDLKLFKGNEYKNVDLFAGGVPCPPFSVAGKQLGSDDERDLFPEALRLIQKIQPKAILLENVKGLFSPRFDLYRRGILQRLSKLGYWAEWRLINSSDYGVVQLRPRTILVGFRKELNVEFEWPKPIKNKETVGELLLDLMSENNWRHAKTWAKKANKIAPTIVGGSKKHGGPDLGPTRAKLAWAELGVDGSGIADHSPSDLFVGNPKLTVRMAARIQGFPDSWKFQGKKTAAYRQVGNAFPPPVAFTLGKAIYKSLLSSHNEEARKVKKSIFQDSEI